MRMRNIILIASIALFSTPAAAQIGGPVTTYVHSIDDAVILAFITRDDGTISRAGDTVQSIVVLGQPESEDEYPASLMLIEQNCATKQFRALGFKVVDDQDVITTGDESKFPSPWKPTIFPFLCNKLDPDRILKWNSVDQIWKFHAQLERE